VFRDVNESPFFSRQNKPRLMFKQNQNTFNGHPSISVEFFLVFQDLTVRLKVVLLVSSSSPQLRLAQHIQSQHANTKQIHTNIGQNTTNYYIQLQLF